MLVLARTHLWFLGTHQPASLCFVSNGCTCKLLWRLPLGYWSCFIPCTEIGKNLGIYCFLGSLASSPQVGTNSEEKNHVSELSVGSGFRLALKPEITSLLGFFISPSCSQDQSPLVKCYEEFRISSWGQQSIAPCMRPC